MREAPRGWDFGLLNMPPGDEKIEPVPPRDAATVVLVRDAASGIEVFLQRRVQAMAFAAGMLVFPGGGVDSRDHESVTDWIGPTPQDSGRIWSCTPQLASALVCAAAREVFEECGVLFAGSATATVKEASRYQNARRELTTGDLSFAQFLKSEGLSLRADLLKPWANWLTPLSAPRRYDTRFFLARVPEGQLADGETSEAESSEWWSVAHALSEVESRNGGLMFPTWQTLAEIEQFSSTSELLSTARTIAKLSPHAVRTGQDVRVITEQIDDEEKVTGLG